MTENNEENHNHFEENKNDDSLQEKKKNIFAKILEWCKRSFAAFAENVLKTKTPRFRLQHSAHLLFLHPTFVFLIILLISVISFFIIAILPQKRIFEYGKMDGLGEFKSASVTRINDENYLVVDARCGTLQPEIYNWKENKFYKTKNKIPFEYMPENHSALQLKNGNVLLITNINSAVKAKNFLLIYDINNQTFTSYDNTDLSKLYIDVYFSELLLINNGNILLFNNNEKNASTMIYYFTSKDFSLIQSNKIDNFQLFEAKQINENEILLYGKKGINYIYNLKNNTYGTTKKYKQINPKLQALKESNYILGWGKPIYMQSGDIVFLDPFLYGKKQQSNKLYSKKHKKLITINDFKYPREDYSTILLPNDTILIFGGTCGNKASEYPYNTVEIYKNRKD